jgi:TolA-binding protein
MKYSLFSLALVFALAGCSKPNAEEMYKTGVDAQSSEKYDDAIEAYQELIKAYPDSVRTPEAYYAIGSIHQNSKRYHQAVDFYRQLASRYPEHGTSPNAAFLIGYIYNNELKQYDSAKTAYEYFLKRYPSYRLAGDAKIELENLGKSPEEIFAAQKKIADKNTRPDKKTKK